MVIDAIDPARPSVGDHAFASYQSSPFGYCARKMPPIPLIRKSEDGLLLLIADSMLTTKRQLNLTIVITTSVAPPELELELLADGAEPRTYRPTEHSCRERDATCVCCAVVPHPTSDDLEWQSLCFTDLGKETMGMDISVMSTLLAIFPSSHSDDGKRM
jgi:hypothetical protein